MKAAWLDGGTSCSLEPTGNEEEDGKRATLALCRESSTEETLCLLELLFEAPVAWGRREGYRTAVNSRAANDLHHIGGPDLHVVTPTGLEPVSQA